jgi:type VI secretion system protein ImpG
LSRHPLYSEYLSVLQDVGAELSRSAPKTAGALAAPSFDPDVELLLKGIAFIASKIDERRIKGLDETCQLMMDILFPHYLCIIPACTIVAFDNRPNDEPRQFERGTELQSVPVGGTACRFVTAYDTVVGGLEIEAATWEQRGSASVLTIRFNGAPWLRADTVPDRIRLFLHGEPLFTRTLYRSLFAYRDSVTVLDSQDNPVDAAEPRLRPVGFAAEEALFDHPLGCFEGFRLLQEYFTLPEKLMFVDIEGVRRSMRGVSSDNTGAFTLRFGLRTNTQLKLTPHHLGLACCPAVNLFAHTADPIQRDPARMDYRVRPVGPHLHFEVGRVRSIRALSSQGALEIPLLAEIDEPTADQRFAQLRRDVHEGEQHVYVSINDDWIGQPAQTLALDLVCTNGKLPTALGLGDIDTVVGDDTLACRNVMPPTTPVTPALGTELRRRLIALMTLSQRELAELDALRTSLMLHHPQALTNPRAAHGLAGVTDALLDTSSESIQMQRRGVTAWGYRTTIQIDPSALPVAAESYVLGSVLNEYIALQAAINGYSEVWMQHSDTQEFFRWPPRIGTQAFS